MAQGVVKPGPRRSLELRGSQELQSGGLRREVAQMGGQRGVAKLRMAGFWMHQVLWMAGFWIHQVDFLSVPNRAKIPRRWLVQKYVHGGFELSEVQGRAELGPGRSQELRGSPELQNGGLTALEDAWMTISRLRHFPVKSGCFLCFWSVHVSQGGVDLGPRKSQEVRGSPELQNGGLRALEEARITTSSLRHFPGYPSGDRVVRFLGTP